MYAKPELTLVGGTFTVVRGVADGSVEDHYRNILDGDFTSDNQLTSPGGDL